MNRHWRLLCLVSSAALLSGASLKIAAESLSDCDNAPFHPLVQRDGPPTEYIRSGNTVALRITITDATRHLSRIQFVVDGVPNLEIQQQEISGFRKEGPTVYATATVSVGQGSAGQLVLPANSTPSVDVLAFDDQADAQRGCGRLLNPIPYRTGNRGPFAIVVGFNYSKESYALKWAQRDAEEIVDHLIHRLHVPPENIALFTDDLKAQKSLKLKGVTVRDPEHPSEIGTAFDAIYNRADDQTFLYFYFSGHEYAGPAEETNKYVDQFYMLLSHSDAYYPETMYGRGVLYKNLSPEKRNINTISIFDACYSGPSEINAARPSGAKVFRAPYIAEEPQEPIPTKGARIASSAGNELSWEFDAPMSHGVFTYNLLQAGKAAQAAGKTVSILSAALAAISDTQSYVPTDTDTRKLYKEIPNWKGDSAAMGAPWVAVK